MKSLNEEMRKLVSQLRSAQDRFQSAVKNGSVLEEARKVAERQKKDVRKLLGKDFDRVMNFIEKERKELDRLQKRLPGEVAKLKKYVQNSRQEFERILKRAKKTAKKADAPTGGASSSKTAKKKPAARKKAKKKKSS